MLNKFCYFVAMIRTYKYRLYPTLKQETVLNNQFGLCRWLYNTALEHRIRSYKTNGTNISYQDQAAELPAIKEQFPAFKQIHSQVLQDTLKRLDKAFQHFFRRVKQRGDKPGFPRFRSKDSFNSFTFPQSGFCLTGGNRVSLSKTGSVRLKLHRQIPESARIKTCTVKKQGDQWYCALCFEWSMTVKNKVVSSAVGIDLGLENFATLSNGKVIDNPRYLRASIDKLSLLQSRYSIKKNKALRKKLIKLHSKIASQRSDFLHKTSRQLVDAYDLIAYEDLNIKAMSKRCRPVPNEDGSFAPNGQSAKSGLNKSIHDAGWGTFIAMIVYKAANAGSYAIAVNPRNTSQICSSCGTVVKKSLSERLHHCPVCDLSVHRDINASHNILRLGTDRIFFVEATIPSG